MLRNIIRTKTLWSRTVRKKWELDQDLSNVLTTDPVMQRQGPGEAEEDNKGLLSIVVYTKLVLSMKEARQAILHVFLATTSVARRC